MYVTCTQERCEGIVRKEYRNYKIIRDTDADVDAMLWYLLWLLKMNWNWLKSLFENGADGIIEKKMKHMKSESRERWWREKKRKRHISSGLKRTSNRNRMLDLYKYVLNVRYKKKYSYKSCTKPVHILKWINVQTNRTNWNHAKREREKEKKRPLNQYNKSTDDGRWLNKIDGRNECTGSGQNPVPNRKCVHTMPKHLDQLCICCDR